MFRLTQGKMRLLDDLVAHFEANRHHFQLISKQLLALFENDKALSRHVHSMKARVKDPSHLRDKLIRKMAEAEEKQRKFAITPENLFYKINDLAGLRIIHLYTHQVDAINNALLSLFEEEKYRLREGPTARTWDDESRKYFKEIGIATRSSPSMYTSVHYVLEPNRRTKYTCELQVRTLMEEVWGEVDHAINYPHPTTIVSCAEQIAALARITSGCTRVVDSIFRTYQDLQPRARAHRRHRPRH
jgi:putative GTP pyrophosphokinase